MCLVSFGSLRALLSCNKNVLCPLLYYISQKIRAPWHDKILKGRSWSFWQHICLQTYQKHQCALVSREFAGRGTTLGFCQECKLITPTSGRQYFKWYATILQVKSILCMIFMPSFMIYMIRHFADIKVGMCWDLLEKGSLLSRNTNELIVWRSWQASVQMKNGLRMVSKENS